MTEAVINVDFKRTDGPLTGSEDNIMVTNNGRPLTAVLGKITYDDAGLPVQ